MLLVVGASGAMARLAPDERDLPPGIAALVELGYPVYCGGGAQNDVALTFDDGPGAFTGQLLDLLARDGSPATFFVLGQMLQRRRQMLRREAVQDEVGDHAWTHSDLRTLPPARVDAEIGNTQAVIEHETGGNPLWLFRPPYGAHDPIVDAAAARRQLLTVLWSVYTNDTALTDPDAIATFVEAGARPGSIILLHENNNRGATIAAMPRILEGLHARGLRPVSVGAMLTHDPPTARQLRTGPYGCGPTVWGVSPAEGGAGGGTVVTITGDQLNRPRDVMFGSRRAEIVDPGDGHTFRVVAPPGTGTVDVTLTTHFGQSPTSSLDRFTYR